MFYQKNYETTNYSKVRAVNTYFGVLLYPGKQMIFVF